MRFHRSNFGRYGDSLPTDSNGYVSCSGPAANKVRDYALKHGVAAARERYEGSVSASRRLPTPSQVFLAGDYRDDSDHRHP
jgi:hypothetical protein